MKSNGENSSYFVLTLMSPVHVGCDEAYEPVGFSVDAAGGGLAVFDPFEYVSGLTEKDRERFSEICQEGSVESLLEIYRFIHGHPGRGRTVEACRGFIEHHRKVLLEKLLEIDRLSASEKMSMDPFRLVKVSDFRPVGPARTKIIYAVNKKKKPSDKDSRGCAF